MASCGEKSYNFETFANFAKIFAHFGNRFGKFHRSGLINHWSGFIKSEEKAKLQSVLNKTARYGFLTEWSPKTIDELLESSDITLFKAALGNPDHVIHPLLPPPKAPGYNNLRKRCHGLLPTTKSNLLRKNFVYRMLLRHLLG